MNKNNIIGFLLIAVVLIGFSWYNQPSAEEQRAAFVQDSIAKAKHAEMEKASKTAAVKRQADAKAKIEADSTALFYSALKGQAQKVVLKNEKVELTLNTKGGTVEKAVIKGYVGHNLKVKDGSADQKDVTLFDGNDQSLKFMLEAKEANIITSDLYFTPSNVTDKSVTMTAVAGPGKTLSMTYTLGDDYMLHMSLQAEGMAGLFSPNCNKMSIDWSDKARQQERGFMFENRYTTLTYHEAEGGTDHLNEGSEKIDEKIEETIDWVSFKNQFFSSVFLADADFEKTKLSSKMETQGSGYIKDYSAEMSTKFDPAGKEPTQLFFYFGPNHYKTLTALDKGRDEKWELNRLVYLGWPLIRWINKWFTINIFDWLSSWGLSMGIVLLFMTLIVKAVVFPATWKTYMSSAKMRVLKPKIDEINKKYPKQEDAMKKQQEVMGLYSQYGVSPMGGCLPMLIQFPILMALFMFVPSAIELRQQSFLWADDLSTYDAFINFPFHIPFLGSHLSLFCLLMTVTNILNTKYMMQQQDTGANPQMAAMKWMSYLMPIMFLFILNDYPSGLNYYYFISTLVSVVTTLIMRKTTNEEALLAQLEANKKDPKKMKKTGFAARLEAMQKQQEQMMKEKQNKK